MVLAGRTSGLSHSISKARWAGRTSWLSTPDATAMALTSKTCTRRHSGFHVTQAVDLAGLLKKPLVATVRFERYWKRFPGVLELDPETGELPEALPSNLNRVTAGIQYPLSELFILKLDYLQFIRTSQESLDNEELGRRAVYAQLVFQF